MADIADNNGDLSQNNSDEWRYKRKNICLWKETHRRRERELVSFLCVIPPHPTPVAMRSNKSRKGKRNIRKENPRKVAKLNFPLLKSVDFIW